MIKIISKKVTHQGIGGKEFIIDQKITDKLTPDDVIEKAWVYNNWACKNFIDRRPDFNANFAIKLYYVKVNNLGYVIADDEIEEVSE